MSSLLRKYIITTFYIFCEKSLISIRSDVVAFKVAQCSQVGLWQVHIIPIRDCGTHTGNKIPSDRLFNKADDCLNSLFGRFRVVADMCANGDTRVGVAEHSFRFGVDDVAWLVFNKLALTGTLSFGYS